MAVAQRTADDLATDAPENDPFASSPQDITDIWIEVDANPLYIIAGGSAGGLALSTNGGSTWSFIPGPDSNPVQRAILSRFTFGEVHVITGGATGGYFVSEDFGTTWRTILLADDIDGEVFLDLSLSHSRNVIASTMGVRIADETGTLLGGIDSGCPCIISVTADIRDDKFYAYDADGATYRMDASGDSSFVSGAPLPDTSQAQVRGAYREGSIPGLIYIANGTNGVWKSVDGYGSPEGYFQVRKASVDGAGSGPWYQVGVGDVVRPSETTS